MNAKSNILKIEPGTILMFENHRCAVIELVDMAKVLIEDLGTQEKTIVPIDKLRPVIVSEETKFRDLNEIPDADWQIANHKFDVIHPLLEINSRTSASIESRAQECKVSSSTIYNWLRAYESEGKVTALLPRERCDKGQKKLSENLELIIEDTIKSEYLTSQRKSVNKVYQEIKWRCKAAGAKPPHPNTVRNRIIALGGKLSTCKRFGLKEADAQYNPLQGNFPGADWPLAVVQIDHTKLDIFLVDDIDRKPVERPWVTVAFDVFSRMVTGFYVSFDPPGAASTGLCLAHSILPKEAWLERHKIEGDWKCYGIPTKVHLDNAREFHGKMLERACQKWSIDIDWRPVARPNFGGHIERWLGTLANEIHALPGTTFSTPTQRKGYDSEGKAVLSLSEFETWLGTYIVNVYHKSIHSSLGITPEEKFRIGIFGDDTHPGIGLPARAIDAAELSLDLMPFYERTIQPYGVVIEDIHYYHDVLRRWINSRDPKFTKQKRKFTFRMDPRDISRIWFYDPELLSYYRIPYRDISLPPISIWELKKIRRKLENEGRQNIDENAIFKAYAIMRKLEEDAKIKTKSIRKARQRRSQILFIDHEKNTPSSSDASAIIFNQYPRDIEPFEEMDDMQS
jgi:putative transposase